MLLDFKGYLYNPVEFKHDGRTRHSLYCLAPCAWSRLPSIITVIKINVTNY